MNTVTPEILPPAVQKAFSAKLLVVPVPDFIHNIPATMKVMPQRSGEILRMRRYNPIKPNLVPLTGVEPPAAAVSAVDIDAKPQLYGNFIRVNEQVTLRNQDPVLNQFVERLGVSLRETEDTLTRDMLKASAGSINCTSGANGDNPTELNKSDIMEVIRTLRYNNAYTVTRSIVGQNRFGTSPIRDSYFALANTLIMTDLENVQGFTNIANYPMPDKALDAEHGAVANLRFLLSSIGSVDQSASALGNDVYNVFCVGMEAYAVVEQDGYTAQFVHRGPEFSDALWQNRTVGFKFAQVPKITNDAWVLNLKTTLAA